eukprot:TRINITY_DN12005_c0_g1_i1.p1 TRINITY_DN12005_c0_g1~~TRINITY_DN12005_c0_g1_i1.p1  ORF type:complete len:337 (+),score=93.48 TRINITY_DN12005_c0_g1_i1:58-1068(+)
MIRRPPRSTLSSSSAASDVYKRQLYDPHMGMENMGLMLYSIVRFVKPKRVLEVGAGYSTVFILQALHDNATEMAQLKQVGSFHGMEDWLVEGSLESAEPAVLHCIDNQEHEVFVEHGGLGAVQKAAESLGLSHLLSIHDADFFDMSPADLAGGCPWDFMWFDGITNDDRWTQTFNRWWHELKAEGGLALVHSTLTNTVNKAWSSELAAEEATRMLATIDLKPLDGEVDLPGLAADLRQRSTEAWSDAHELVPMCYGMSKLRMSCTFELSEYPDTEALAECLVDQLEDQVSSTEVVNERLDSLGDFAMVGLLEPHKKYQNSFTMLQKRGDGYSEPLY